MVSKIILFANEKGGIAKSTSVFNVGVALSSRGKTVLLVDTDYHAGLTHISGLDPLAYGKCSAAMIQPFGVPASDCVLQLRGKLFIITSRPEISAVADSVKSNTVLRDVLSPIRDDYDYILLDCPQSGVLMRNALACSDYVIIPIETDNLARKSAASFEATVHQSEINDNPGLKILGAIATKYKSRIKDDNIILHLLQERYDIIAVIKNLAIGKKGVYDGLAVEEIDPKNDISVAYGEIADYIIRKAV